MSMARLNDKWKVFATAFPSAHAGGMLHGALLEKARPC
jgi:hypothetical protein